jgi:hypothetical protein
MIATSHLYCCTVNFHRYCGNGIDRASVHAFHTVNARVRHLDFVEARETVIYRAQANANAAAHALFVANFNHVLSAPLFGWSSARRVGGLGRTALATGRSLRTANSRHTRVSSGAIPAGPSGALGGGDELIALPIANDHVKVSFSLSRHGIISLFSCRPTRALVCGIEGRKVAAQGELVVVPADWIGSEPNGRSAKIHAEKPSTSRHADTTAHIRSPPSGRPTAARRNTGGSVNTFD